LLSALACLSLGTQAQTSPSPPSADGNAEVMLAPVTVQDSLAGETATGPVSGFVARRAISATKTDTPLIETPQSISVVTRDQFEAQGVTTLRETTRYTAGINSSYFDNRVDSSRPAAAMSVSTRTDCCALTAPTTTSRSSPTRWSAWNSCAAPPPCSMARAAWAVCST
jgi:hypothetical protein